MTAESSRLTYLPSGGDGHAALRLLITYDDAEFWIWLPQGTQVDRWAVDVEHDDEGIAFSWARSYILNSPALEGHVRLGTNYIRELASSAEGAPIVVEVVSDVGYSEDGVPCVDWLQQSMRVSAAALLIPNSHTTRYGCTITHGQAVDAAPCDQPDRMANGTTHREPEDGVIFREKLANYFVETQSQGRQWKYPIAADTADAIALRFWDYIKTHSNRIAKADGITTNRTYAKKAVVAALNSPDKNAEVQAAEARLVRLILPPTDSRLTAHEQ